MIQWSYFRHGMFWKHRYVPLLSAFFLAVVVAGVMAWAWLLEQWLKDSMAEVMRQKEEAVKTLLDCMNGRAVWKHPNGKRTGFGFRVHKCMGVEEFDV